MAILLNRIQTPDGTIITSRSRHDYVSYEDDNGSTYAVDGGCAYLRRQGPLDFKEMSLMSTEPFAEIRRVFEWGTYGRAGKDKLTYIKLRDLTEDHIRVIIGTQDKFLRPEVSELFRRELNFRGL